MASTTTTIDTPVVTHDPRFGAGRTLIKSGLSKDGGAIEIFSTLLEECIAKFGESSIETCPAYFEYGNALLRCHLASEGSDEEAEDLDQRTSDEKPSAAAIKSEDEDKPDKIVPSSADLPVSSDAEAAVKQEDDVDEDNDETDSDLNLALEMMENAYSILEESQEGSAPKYVPWIKEQKPRILLGLGDCLSALSRHADAADAFSRALEIRQEQLQAVTVPEGPSLEQLRAQRLVCEATVLITEELLACPNDEDVVTSETQALIVKAAELEEYIRGYYDKARDGLQETVVLLGTLAAKKVDLGTEKEDVCYVATMIMGVGEELARRDEIKDLHSHELEEPTGKRRKTA
eukprot:Nitzschia sp. Nitz4//scaffold2_size372955//67270//68310//NITZ4_000376-RA/size372955-processed-gene-0.477-mRNA-1//-1//CDS//3329546635//2581//frame0